MPFLIFLVSFFSYVPFELRSELREGEGSHRVLPPGALQAYDLARVARDVEQAGRFGERIRMAFSWFLDYFGVF